MPDGPERKMRVEVRAKVHRKEGDGERYEHLRDKVGRLGTGATSMIGVISDPTSRQRRAEGVRYVSSCDRAT